MTCAICGRPIGGPDKYCITCSTQKRQAVRTPAVVLAVGLSLVGVKVAVEGLGSTLSDVVAFFRPAPAPGQPPPVQAVQAPANHPPVKPPEPVAPPAAGPGPVASTEVAKAESAPEGKSPAAPPASPPRPDEESAEEKAARVAKRVDELDLQLDDRNRRNDALRELAALGPKARSLMPKVVKLTDWSRFDERTVETLDAIEPRWRDSAVAKEHVGLALPYFEETFGEWRDGGPAINRIRLIGPMAKGLSPRLAEVLFKDDPEVHRMALEALDSIDPEWRKDPAIFAVAKAKLKQLSHVAPVGGGVMRGPRVLYNASAIDAYGQLGPAALPFLPELRRVQKELRRFGKADFQNAEADETLSSAIGRIEAEESPQGTR